METNIGCLPHDNSGSGCEGNQHRPTDVSPGYSLVDVSLDEHSRLKHAAKLFSSVQKKKYPSHRPAALASTSVQATFTGETTHTVVESVSGYG